jgi:hypothetical protein
MSKSKKIPQKIPPKEETDIMATLMLKEAFDNEVVYVLVRIGKRIVMLNKEEFMSIYVPTGDRLSKIAKKIKKG